VNWFRSLIDAGSNLAPHGYCLLWQPELVWTHVIADALIAAAYFSIPLAIIKFVRNRDDIKFTWIFWLFALFITACGTTHLMMIYNLWNSAYGWEAVIKVITAIASVGTAIVLWPLIPKLLALPSPLHLSQKNEELKIALSQLNTEIAERKRMEEALRQAQKMEAVGQLTGGIAHDFNNLLQAVSGSLSLIAREPHSPKVTAWAELGAKAAERGAKLTGQLLTFSRIQKLELRPTLISPILMEMSELIQSTIGPSVKISMNLDPKPFHVLCDPTQVELAVMNLAINARDAMPNGGDILVSSEAVDIQGDPELSDGRYQKISVADTGVGMSPEVIARAFEPFYTTKGVGKGTGLGLSMVYSVAQQSGGRAVIESIPDQGTTVYMLLPEVAAPVTSTKKNSDVHSTTEEGTVLVVDDDSEVRAMTVSMLEALGQRVIEASSGAEAISIVGDTRVDLVIMDFAMPEMTGAEAARRIRASGAQVPIVFATGYMDTEELEKAVGKTATVMRKPFSFDDLTEVIIKELRRPD
jgi:signal transduction histidine kinase